MLRSLRTRGSLYLLAAIVGAVAGCGAVAFEYLSGAVVALVLVRGAGYLPAMPRGEVRLFATAPAQGLSLLALLLAPAAGNFVSCALCRLFAPEASGHGTDAAIDAYHRRGGLIRARVPLVKTITSAITLGTGGSGGREGPIAQIGAGFGSLLGQILRLSEARRRTLLAAGMAAGVGAIFRAPFAGALFAAEILYREAELESEVLMPAFISSTVAYCVFCGWMGEFGTLFELGPGFEFHRLGELLPYALLALLLVPVSAAFANCFYGCERWCARLPGPRPLIAASGGLLTAVLAIALLRLTGDPLALSVLSYGYGILQAALDGSLSGWHGAELLLLVGLLKVAATSLTIASGGSGGLFGPSMVIGGSVGGAVGLACRELGLVDNPASFVVVGMCGFFAGAAKTPISTIIMVTEMTGSYRLLLPAMWVCGLTFLLSRRWTLYRHQVPHRALSPAHRGEYQIALLEEMTVADVFEPSPVETVAVDLPLADVVQRIASSSNDYFPVVDAGQRLVGIFSARDVRAFMLDQTLHRLAIASDIMTSPPITVTPMDDLHTAMEKLDFEKLDELPVVDAADRGRLLGRLHRRDIGRAYNKKLEELRRLRQDARRP